jgi:hypothetical protein
LLLGWIENFLTGRTQRVSINGATSDWKEVTSGIPQGSVLGPLLFILFINDLPDGVKSDVYLLTSSSCSDVDLPDINPNCLFENKLTDL